jgi:TolB-like protein
VVVGLALLAPLLAAAVAWQVWRSRQPDAGPIRSLAVLPFANLSPDAEQEYLADGITDALITELAGIRSLRVISRQSVIRYKDSTKSLPEIARELGVDGIVEGTVLRSGSRVRVSAQVVHGPRDEHLWARSFEGAAGDMLPLQAEIARAVADGVRVKLTAPEQARLARAADVDPEAYDLYLRGRYFFNRLLVDDMETVLLKCVSYLQRAVQKDPRFAAAHGSLAFCYVPLAYFGLRPPWEATPLMEKHARKALELDPEVAEGHLALASSLFFQFDWAGAEAEYRKAIESNPNDAQIRQMYCYFLLTVGRFDESLAQSAQGMRIDPFYPWVSSNHVSALFELGRSEEALAEARHIVETETAPQSTLGLLYLQLGREQEALAEFERIGSTYGIALVQALRGDPSGLRAILGQLNEREQQRYVSPVEFATLLTALGDKDAAFARLEEAYRTKATGVHLLKTGWVFRPLRSDPRWNDLVHRLKLD